MYCCCIYYYIFGSEGVAHDVASLLSSSGGDIERGVQHGSEEDVVGVPVAVPHLYVADVGPVRPSFDAKAVTAAIQSPPMPRGNCPSDGNHVVWLPMAAANVSNMSNSPSWASVNSTATMEDMAAAGATATNTQDLPHNHRNDPSALASGSTGASGNAADGASVNSNNAVSSDGSPLDHGVAGTAPQQPPPRPSLAARFRHARQMGSNGMGERSASLSRLSNFSSANSAIPDSDLPQEPAVASSTAGDGSSGQQQQQQQQPAAVGQPATSADSSVAMVTVVGWPAGPVAARRSEDMPAE